MDDVRKAFASANKVQASLFSFNSKGACENCQGLGVVYTELSFFDSVKSPCEICGGKRFKDEVLAYKLNGKSISDVLAMNVEQALEYFEIKEVLRQTASHERCGFGLSESGAAAEHAIWRRMSAHQTRQRTAQAGQHLHHGRADHWLAHVRYRSSACEIINRLVDTGNTVIVIEHNLHVIKNADWIIDMGPEGGSKGGKVMFEGTPKQSAHGKEFTHERVHTQLIRTECGLLSAHNQYSRCSVALAWQVFLRLAVFSSIIGGTKNVAISASERWSEACSR